MRLAEHPLLSGHAGGPAILDANLLLLRFCCRFNPSLLRSFKRLSSFEAGDVALLDDVLRVFRSLWTTPHVLTEVSNLSSALPSWARDGYFQFFANEIKVLPEIYTTASEIAKDAGAIRFGLTDAALALLSSEYVILTIDWPLANLLESRGLKVINFNHLREAFLFS